MTIRPKKMVGYFGLLATVVILIAVFLQFRANQLAIQQADMLEERFLATKRAELKSYLDLALSLVMPLYDSGLDDSATKERVKAILQTLSYGSDGYFFAYDADGTNLVHPRKPELIGKNLWHMKDNQGRQVIQLLMQAAKSGKGYQLYDWEKPSTHKITDKLGYVAYLERWGWMVGTGIYLDDVDAAARSARMRAESNLRSLTGFALLSVLLVCAFGFTMIVREQRASSRQLNVMAQRIVTLQEEERAHISRELHDGICQTLVSVKYQLDGAAHALGTESHPASDVVCKGLDTLRGAIAEVRDISHQLRPAVLDALGLPAAIAQLAKEFEQRTAIPVTITNDSSDATLSWSSQVALFRIAQEGLTNIERHASATAVTLSLAANAAWINMSIRDNGHGFDPGNPSATAGIGLRNMRERIRILGGRFQLNTKPGGTELSVTLPRRD